MNQSPRNAIDDIPILLNFVEELSSVLLNILDNTPEYSDDEHILFLSLSFGMKQLEHAKPLVILVKHNQDRDAGLIARTSLSKKEKIQFIVQVPQVLQQWLW